jgi:Tol biopolymer transport system component
MKVAAATAVAVAVAAGGSSARSAEPIAAELVFARGTPSRSEIYVVREDGTQPRRLTTNRVADHSPVWSPDGARILFASRRDGDEELYVMDADGRNVRQLTRNRRSDLTPQWSPDGAWIAFASDRARPREPEIWVMRADGTGARRLVRTVDHRWPDFAYSPTWSPDQKRIVFSMTATDGNPELFVVSVDGRGLKRLTRTRGDNVTLGDDTMPEWSRDGRSIIFVSNREGRDSDVWVMSPDGKRQRPLVRRRGIDDWHPRLSPDGSRIAFTQLTLPQATQSIWVMRADGKNARRLGPGSEPHWRPARP